MTERTLVDANTASSLLSMNDADVAAFVRSCVRNRSLSTVVADLNKDLLFGNDEDSDRAHRALKHIGFV